MHQDVGYAISPPICLNDLLTLAANTLDACLGSRGAPRREGAASDIAQDCRQFVRYYFTFGEDFDCCFAIPPL
jgi:hypothetical protein